MITPLQRYESDLRREDFHSDPAQANAVAYTQKLFDALVFENQQSSGFFENLKNKLGKANNPPIKGLYFWGGVGRGKTYIIDCFYDCLPFENKWRIHFHRFMQRVHQELKLLENVQNPLELVADKLANDLRILCLDEFHVTDITDAMLLAGLLDALFKRGVILVTTSNEVPDKLYSNGLQRDRFLPAIQLLKHYTRVINVDSGMDYRLEYLDHAEIYHSPLDENAQAMLEKNFIHLSPDVGNENFALEVEGREIMTQRCGDGVVWFDFYDLCDGPRGPADYIEIGRCYQTVLLANLPIMGELDNDKAKRFMTMVDEFYDRNVKLIITAEAEPEGLYTGKALAQGFKRTISRLQEMRTHDYLAKQHLS